MTTALQEEDTLFIMFMCDILINFLKTCFVEFTNASQIKPVNRKLFEVNLKVLFNN